MQVSLLSKRGVPEDALISIRSGAVRRQGAISADKPFRFPQNVSETDCVVKVDIMQTVGSGYIVMRPNQTESKQYEVIMNNDSDMVCELEVTPTSGGGPTPTGAEEAAAAAKSKQDAKAYLESTGLLPFVQGVLQVVAKQQPEDPFAAMAKHFLSASDEAAPPQPGSPKAAPALPKAVEAAPAPASPKAVEAASAPASPKAETPAPESPKAEAAAETEPPAPASPAEVTAGEAAPDRGAEAAPQGDPATEEPDKAESDHVDDQKSDTLEEFTSTVKAGALADNGGAAAEATAVAEEAADGEEKGPAADAAAAENPISGEAEIPAEVATDGAGEAAQPEKHEESPEKPPEEAAAADESGAA